MVAELDGVVNQILQYLLNAAEICLHIKGVACKDQMEGNLFFQLISELQEQTSIIITTNKGFEEWAEFLDDIALATAILDRLSYRCDRIQMSGKSYRLENRKSFLEKGADKDEIS